MKKLTGKEYMVLAVETIILITLLFGKWLGLEAIFINSKTTLMHFGKIVSQISSYVGSFGLIALSIFVYGGLITSIVSLGITASSLFKPYKGRDTAHALYGFYVPAVFSVAIILLVIVTNAVIKAKTEGWVPGVFGLNAAPYLTIILSVGGVFAYKKLPDASFDIAKEAVQNTVEHVKDTVAKESVICPNCGEKCKDGSAFCPHCGKKLPASAVQICSKCGANMSPNAKFCPNCGSPVEKSADNPVNADKAQ